MLEDPPATAAGLLGFIAPHAAQREVKSRLSSPSPRLTEAAYSSCSVTIFTCSAAVAVCRPKCPSQSYSASPSRPGISLVFLPQTRLRPPGVPAFTTSSLADQMLNTCCPS